MASGQFYYEQKSLENDRISLVPFDVSLTFIMDYHDMCADRPTALANSPCDKIRRWDQGKPRPPQIHCIPKNRDRRGLYQRSVGASQRCSRGMSLRHHRQSYRHKRRWSTCLRWDGRLDIHQQGTRTHRAGRHDLPSISAHPRCNECYRSVNAVLSWFAPCRGTRPASGGMEVPFWECCVEKDGFANGVRIWRNCSLASCFYTGSFFRCTCEEKWNERGATWETYCFLWDCLGWVGWETAPDSGIDAEVLRLQIRSCRCIIRL